MNASPGNRLSDTAVLLSASVPNRKDVSTKLYAGPLPDAPDRDLRIENAVIALARAVFAEGGQIVFGGHPAISPLIAMVASEYYEPASDEPNAEAQTSWRPIVTFQSHAFDDVIVDDVRTMERLGQAHIRWTNAVDGERFNPELMDRKQCQASLGEMRRQMVALPQIAAMVCIGGMDGIFDEYAAYVEREGPKRVIVYGSTGGAAAVLARKFARESDIEIADGGFDDETAAGSPPYQLIAEDIVDALAPREDDDGDDRDAEDRTS